MKVKELIDKDNVIISGPFKGKSLKELTTKEERLLWTTCLEKARNQMMEDCLDPIKYHLLPVSNEMKR